MPNTTQPGSISHGAGPWEPDENGAVDYDPVEEQPHEGILQVKDAHEQRLLALPGVVGVGIGQTDIGGDAVMVYLEYEGTAAGLPKTLESVPVVWEVTGPIDLQDSDL